MTLDLRWIRHAVALADHGSFSRAADALGIAQPTLSRSIRDLEAEVGLPLFSRHRWGAEPTDFGYMFLQQAALVAGQLVDLEREVALAKGLQKGELAVGFGPYAAELLVTDALPRFASAHPAARVRIQVDALETLGRSLRTRTLDLVIGESTILADDESIELVEHLAPPIPAHVFVRAGHPLQSRSAVTLRDVLDYPFLQISRLPPRALKPMVAARTLPARQGKELPLPALECPFVSLGMATVAGSDAAVIATLGMAKQDLAKGRVVPILHEPWMQSDWSIMRLRKRTLGPAATKFIAQLQESHRRAVSEDAVLTKRWIRDRPPHGQAQPRPRLRRAGAR
jgi:DNA-binding transcriptional LysR family regulator